MMTRDSSYSQSSDMRTSIEPDVVFTGAVPTHWAMIYVGGSGNVGEVSNLPAAVFDSRARHAFLAAHNSLPSPHTAYSAGHRGLHEEALNVGVVEAFEGLEGQVPLEIGNTEEVTEFYTKSFKRLQQINCRLLAKNLIKTIEPRKQVHFPYNGGRKPGGAPGEKGDPEDTKPPWWPRDVIHREPDHITKEYRLKLLVHLVQNLLPMGITVKSFEGAVNDTKRHLLPENKAMERAAILDEIIRVREKEEQYLRGKIDGTIQVYVTHHDGTRRGEDESEGDVEAPKVMTQSASSSPQMQYPKASQSPLDMASMPQHISLPVTTSSFQMPAELSFTNLEKQTPDSASTQPEFGPLHTSTHNRFIEPSQFAKRSPTDHLYPVIPAHAQTNPSFTGWPPAFQQNVFSPINYSNGANHQMPPQVGYPSYGPPSSPFAVQELSRPVPELSRPGVVIANMYSPPSPYTAHLRDSGDVKPSM